MPDIDAQQQPIIDWNEGPLLVAAGPGSGKTSTTTRRVTRRINEGVNPERVMLLTFTNKAAREMRERIGAGLDFEIGTVPFATTFHSLGRQLIRMNPAACDRRPHATLMDAKEAREMMNRALKEQEIDSPETQGGAMAVHEWLRNEALNLKDESDRQKIKEELIDQNVEASAALKAFEHYEKLKQESNLLDFDDLIVLPTHGLERNPGWSKLMREYLHDLTIDEFQDTNTSQYRMMRCIAPHTTIIVGDDDQSIYRWRHARPELMHQFAEDFNADIKRIESNYRSTPHIVEASANMIKKNAGNRIEKTSRPMQEKDDAEKPALVMHDNLMKMNKSMAKSIASSIKRGTPPSEIAVLYRTHRLASDIEQALTAHNIKTTIKEGTDLLSRVEVRMLHALGRVVYNERDANAFERIAQIIPGLGPKKVQSIKEKVAKDPDNSPFDFIPGGKAGENMKSLGKAIRAFRKQNKPAALPNFAIHKCPGFREWMTNQAENALKQKHKLKKNEVSNEMINAQLKVYVQRYASLKNGIKQAIRELSPESSEGEKWTAALDTLAGSTGMAEEEEEEAVTLSTLHAAKGLEWDEVHIAGMSENILPLGKDGQVGNIVEERCLAFVGITRARERLYAHHADFVNMGAGSEPFEANPSRFIKEAEVFEQLDQRNPKRKRQSRAEDDDPGDSHIHIPAMMRVR